MVNRAHHTPAYGFDDVLKAVEDLKPEAAQLAQAAEVSDNTRTSFRHKAARAVAIAYLAGFGPAMFAALVTDRLEASARRAVNISEAWRIMREHAEAKLLAPQWAQGDFSKYPLAAALTAVRPVRDPLDVVKGAVKRAVAAGLDRDAIEEAVKEAEVEAEAEATPEGEEETPERPTKATTQRTTSKV